MWDASYSIVWPLWIRPKILLFWGFFRAPFGQHWSLAVEGYADYSAGACSLLEYGRNLPAPPDQRPNATASFGGQVAELDTAARIHGHGERVGRVLGLRDEFDWFAWLADCDLEAARWPALVGVVGAYNG